MIISKAIAFLGAATTAMALVSDMDRSSKMFSLMLLFAGINVLWGIMLWGEKKLRWALVLGLMLGALMPVRLKYPAEASAIAFVFLMCLTLYHLEGILRDKKKPVPCNNYRTGECDTCALATDAIGGCPYGRIVRKEKNNEKT